MPLFIPPALVGALGVLGAVAAVRVIAKQWRRVNAELHPPENSRDGGGIAWLERDPATGVYRPERARH